MHKFTGLKVPFFLLGGHVLLAEEIYSAGGNASFIKLDITGKTDRTAAIEATVTRFGKLDIFINNAGIVSKTSSIEERTADECDRIMVINVKGVFLDVKHAIEHQTAEEAMLRAATAHTWVNLDTRRQRGMSVRLRDTGYSLASYASKDSCKPEASATRRGSMHPQDWRP